METVLDLTGPDPLERYRDDALPCAGTCPSPAIGRVEGDVLHVDETLPARLRAALRAVERLPRRVVLTPTAGADPFGPDAYLQSASFLTAAAALEAGVGIAVLTRGAPARGFAPLFARHPGQVVAQVAVAESTWEPDRTASWSARVDGIGFLAAAGVPTWLRIDPFVPGRGDESDRLRAWLAPAAAAGAQGVVVAPLMLDTAALERLVEEPAVLDYYRPGRRPRRGGLPAPPERFLPLEREAALLWRVRTAAQDLGLTVRLCRCARGVRGACGLAVVGAALSPVQAGQMALFASRSAG